MTTQPAFAAPCRGRLAESRKRLGSLLLLLFLGTLSTRADDASELKSQLELLRKQNQELQQQMEKQQERLERLGRTVTDLQRAAGGAGDAEPALRPSSSEGGSARSRAAGALGKVHISGEGGVAFFRHEAGGRFPNAEMRADEAKLFVETPVWNDVYFFTELNLFRREDPNDVMNVGELYLDFENLSRWWGRDSQLSLRLGRLDIPFGEEYLSRDAIDNPLVSHSVADFWGVDEGLELYGSLGKVQYVVAVQNGGHPSLRDFDEDKAVAVRLGYDPAEWVHLGVSGMRTGNLNVKGDQLSELWVGNGFVRSLGSTNTTRFRADLVQGDVKVRWRGGHLGLSGGYMRYTDDDPSAHNGRDVYFYSVEAVQQLTKKLYAGARFSEILARKGFPLVGDGDFEEYFLDELTDELWRLSLGLGYRFSPNLLLKAEYSFNQGSTPEAEKRRHENLVAAEIAFKF